MREGRKATPDGNSECIEIEKDQTTIHALFSFFLFPAAAKKVYGSLREKIQKAQDGKVQRQLEGAGDIYFFSQ